MTSFHEMANPKTIEYTFVVPLPANGRVQFDKMQFDSREDWFDHAMTTICSMNLNHARHEETEKGYKFVFHGYRDFMVFDVLTTGDKIGTYASRSGPVDSALAPFYERAIKMFFWDKGISPAIEEKDAFFTLTFDRKSELVTFLTGAQTIHEMALAAQEKTRLPTHHAPKAEI